MSLLGHIRIIAKVLVAARILCVALNTRPAAAAPITYSYSGTITSAAASTGIAPGTHFDGTFTYDPATKPFGLMAEGIADYTFGIPPSTVPDTSKLSLQFGGQSIFNGQKLNVDLADMSDAVYPPPPGTHIPTSTHWSVLSHDDLVNVTLDFNNPNLSLNPSLSLTRLYSIGDFPTAQLQVTDREHKTGAIIYAGTIDTLSAVSVPEPTTFAIVAFAFGGLAVCAKRRRGR